MDNDRAYDLEMKVKRQEVRIKELEAANVDLLKALTRITNGAIAVYEEGEKHGMSARAELDHRDLTFARAAITKAKRAAALDGKPE